MKRTRLIGSCLSAILALASTAGAQVKYVPVDLGTLGGSFSGAFGINGPRQTVGASSTAGDAAFHAFLKSSKTAMQDLGTLGGTNSSAQAINDVGQVVGQSDTADGNKRAFLFTVGGSMQDLGTLGGSFSQANAVNLPPNDLDTDVEMANQFAGWSFTSGDFATHAVIWDASLHIGDLGTLGGTNSQALGNNCVGQVVGSSNTLLDAATDAFLWDSVNGMQDLGTLGGTFAQANGINCSGVIVGFSSLPGDTQIDAFVLANGSMKDIGNLGGSFSQASAINDQGSVVVGFSNTAGDADVHAFVWTARNGLQDLNGLIPAGTGWDLNAATSISNQGTIAGFGTINGLAHAFVLIPQH